MDLITEICIFELNSSQAFPLETTYKSDRNNNSYNISLFIICLSVSLGKLHKLILCNMLKYKY